MVLRAYYKKPFLIALFCGQYMIVAIIQARLSSKRLPEKVMLHIMGKPIIWHIFKRLNYCNLLDNIVISTGESNNNQKICEFASNNNIPFYSGSETDLIDRLYQTAIKFHANVIVRVTADNPLTDPKIVDMMVSKFLEKNNQYDIVTNYQIPSFPYGLNVEVYSLDVLKRLWKEITELKFREWFTIYIKNNSKLFKIFNIKNLRDLSYLRWTVDYPEDYEFVKQIYQYLYKENTIFTMDDVIKLLEQKPELIQINAMHVNKSNIDSV